MTSYDLDIHVSEKWSWFTALFSGHTNLKYLIDILNVFHMEFHTLSHIHHNVTSNKQIMVLRNVGPR